MKKIIITQRYERIGNFKELRDNLDARLSETIEKLGFIPILLPNKLKNIENYLQKISPHRIVVSGGGDPQKKDLRHKNEKKIIKYSIKKKLPIIGICRGAQVLNIYYGGKIKKIKNHVKKKHRIFGNLVKKKKIYTNSYHDYGFDEKLLARNFKILAYSFDKIVKCFCHKKYKILGIMWHPERNKTISNFDKKIIKSFFNWYF